MNLSYTLIQSNAENPDFNAKLQLHFLDLGYLAHYDFSEESKGLYTDLLLSARLGGLYRTVNEAPITSDGSTVKALGIGGALEAKLGYQLPFKTGYSWSPFVSVGYAPYFYSPNSEGVLNQTVGLVGKKTASVLFVKVGLGFGWKR